MPTEDGRLGDVRLVSTEGKTFVVSHAEADKCGACSGEAVSFTFDAIRAPVLAVCVAFLRKGSSAEEVQAVLTDQHGSASTSDLLQAANRMQIPPLILLCASRLASVSESSDAMPPPTGMLGADADIRDFLMRRCVLVSAQRTPAQLAAALVEVTTPPHPLVVDTLWYSRWWVDYGSQGGSPSGAATALGLGSAVPPGAPHFSEHEGRWLQFYAETRVSMFLVGGIDLIEEDEMQFWSSYLGKHVRTLDLRGAGDTCPVALQLAQAACPSVVEIDVTGVQSVTEELVAELVDRFPELRICHVGATSMTPKCDLVALLPQVAPRLSLKWDTE